MQLMFMWIFNNRLYSFNCFIRKTITYMKRYRKKLTVYNIEHNNNILFYFYMSLLTFMFNCHIRKLITFMKRYETYIYT